MRKWITTNLGIKFLSLFTALLLWFHVTTERTYENTVTVPIQCINLGKNLLVTKAPPQSVKVKIRGKGKELLRFRRSAKITLDLSETELGWKRIELEKENIELPPESKIAVVSSPTPKSFVMRIEEKVNKTVKVTPTLNVGTVREPSLQVQVIPETVEISGGRTAVTPISKIATEEISVPDNLPATLKVRLIIPEDVRASVNSVTVNLKSP